MRIPAEFIARFIRYQNRVKVINIFHSCLVSAFNISVQSQSTMFRAVQSMHFITVSLGLSFSFSWKISLSRQKNHSLSQTRSSLLKFSAQYSALGYVL